MGFTTSTVTAAASTLTNALTGYAQYQEGRALKKAASAQESLANSQAEAAIGTAMSNQISAKRNAGSRMAAARADAAVSNLADDGSARLREVDLATRLEDEISKDTDAALQQAEATRQQGKLNAWNTRNMARQAKYKAFGSGLAATGSLLSAFISPTTKN